MKKKLVFALVLAGAFLFAATARAQNFVTITGTVQDPNGIPYGNGTMSAVLVPGTPGGWRLGGQPYSGRVGPVTLDSTGKFTANFGNNSVILPAGTTWQITVNSNQGGIAPPLGTGAQTFSVNVSLTTSSDISATLNAAAPKLTNITVGSGSVTSVSGTSPIVATPNPITGIGSISCPTCIVTNPVTSCTTSGGVAYENGTPNTLTCDTGNVWNATNGLLTLINHSAGSGDNIALLNSNDANPLDFTFMEQTGAGAFFLGQANSTTAGETAGLSLNTDGSLEVGTNNTDGTNTEWDAIPNGDMQLFTDVGKGLCWQGTTLGQACIGVPATSGTPAQINLPTTTGTVGQVLRTDGGNPQQTSWITPSTVATAVPLSGITAATGANTIANGNNPQTWNWAQTTDSQIGITFGETSAATGGTLTNGLANQANVRASTATNSTATPFNVTQGSITNTVATPATQVRMTWNNAGLAGRGFGVSLTNTASAVLSFPVFLNVGNSTLFGLDTSGLIEMNGSASITSSPPASGLSVTSGWRYCLGNANGGSGTGCVAYDGAGNGAEYHLLNLGGNAWFTLSTASPSASHSADAVNLNSKFSFYNSAFSMIGLEHAGCGFTTLALSSLFCADSTSHEFLAATNGSSSLGMLVRRQPSAINSGDQTAAISTATLCAAAAGACNVAGQYEVHFDFIETGTACATPGTGGVTFLLTWTDANGTAHSAVSLGMDDASAINAVSQTFHFQTSLAAAWASGQFTLSSNGSIIQYATGYTACSVGTGTYRVQASVVRLQ